jgi:flagellar biosynthesis/type III secretory pathway chaperone
MEINQEITALFDSLLDILLREIEVYRQMHSVMAEEKRILMKPSLEGLTESNALKETWILKAKLLEEVRDNIVKRIAESIRMNQEDITITAMASDADERCKKNLLACQVELKTILNQIQALNDGNRLLIDNSLSFIGSSIRFMNDMFSQRTGYRENGAFNLVNRNGKMLSVEG